MCVAGGGGFCILLGMYHLCSWQSAWCTVSAQLHVSKGVNE